jgi:hypothetical protein
LGKRDSSQSVLRKFHKFTLGNISTGGLHHGHFNQTTKPRAVLCCPTRPRFPYRHADSAMNTITFDSGAYMSGEVFVLSFTNFCNASVARRDDRKSSSPIDVSESFAKISKEA